ncbi:hypothetical protein HMN09_00834400 [Mycena chlorophos]|uniref:Uncharacterized protein n=1 Tax=Mycena chlorophos TaxID=658473 RepID=A0A8H6SRT1_MYCCL|nr:hypothetical protein HMN09_00834400 [Mycena chlorophos]
MSTSGTSTRRPGSRPRSSGHLRLKPGRIHLPAPRDSVGRPGSRPFITLSHGQATRLAQEERAAMQQCESRILYTRRQQNFLDALGRRRNSSH